MLSTLIPTQTNVAPEDVLSAVVEAKGNPRLVQDIIKRRYDYDIELPAIVDVVKDRLPELKAQMETVAILELFSLMPILHKTLVENLSNLEASDSVTAYMKLMDLITRQTSANEINLNINDQRWRLIPRDVQQTFAALEASGQLDKIIDHEHVVSD